MSLSLLVPSPEIPAFIREYYQRRPFSRASASTAWNELGSWESFVNICRAEGADVMVVRKNEQFSGETPQDEGAMQKLLAEGYTILVRHAELHSQQLRETAQHFCDEFASVVDVQIYCTPANQFGFAWHYDPEEVFLIQTVGSKEYSLRKNTVNPWPILESIPRDMRYEREIMPLMKCLLATGDWLYIPSGYWHMGSSRELSITIALGIAPRTPVEIYDVLRRRVIDSLLWRQRLPVLGNLAIQTDEELQSTLKSLLGELSRDFAKIATDDKFVRKLLSELRGIPE